MKKLVVLLFFLSAPVASYAASFEVVYGGTPEANDRMGNAVNVVHVGGTYYRSKIVGVKGEDGMGAVMYYEYDSLDDPIYIKYQGNPGDGFGHAIAAGNFDGIAGVDYAISAPWADYGSYTDAGEVYIFSRGDWENPMVLRNPDPQNSAGFGFSLAGADVIDNLGGEELIVGIPYQDHSGATNAGAIRIFFSLAPPPVPWPSTVIHQATSGITGTPEANDRFGWSLAADYENNTIAIGVPYEAVGEESSAGMVHLIKMGAAGAIASSTHFNQGYPAEMAGAPEAGDLFGYSVAIDDVGVMIGVPGEDLTVSGVNRANAGAVQTVGIDPDSLTPTSFNFYQQGDGTFSGTPEANDNFGWAVSMQWNRYQNQWGGSELAEIFAVGVPGENNDAGLVQIRGEYSANLSQAVFSEGSESGDRFGEAVYLTNSREVFVGSPGEDVGSAANAGAAFFADLGNMLSWYLTQW